MDLSNLRPAKGATHSEKRIGRGQGSGRGGTSTRGHKGDGSRSGHKTKRHFEGGQMPLQMRLPKVGFKNINRIEYVAINLARLQSIAEKFELDNISIDSLFEHGIIKRGDRVKILGGGNLTKKLSVHAHACSESAKQTIEEQGGNINLV